MSAWRRPRVVVLGDSLVRPLEEILCKSPCHNYPVLPYPGVTILSLHRGMSSLIKDYDVQAVFIHTGTNSLGKTVQHGALKHFKMLFQRCKEKFPSARIVINGILLCDDELDNSRYYMNVALGELCRHYDLKFSTAGSDVPWNFYKGDGLHLCDKGSELFAQDVEMVIQRELSPRSECKMPAWMYLRLTMAKKKRKKKNRNFTSSSGRVHVNHVQEHVCTNQVCVIKIIKGILEKVYLKSQILEHEYWTILDHFCVPVLEASE